MTLGQGVGGIRHGRDQGQDRPGTPRQRHRKGARHVLTNAQMGYAYRHSSAPQDLIFTRAIFEGMPADKDEIRAAMDAVQHHREQR